jgi:hypothetical protein
VPSARAAWPSFGRLVACGDLVVQGVTRALHDEVSDGAGAPGPMRPSSASPGAEERPRMHCRSASSTGNPCCRWMSMQPPGGAVGRRRRPDRHLRAGGRHGRRESDDRDQCRGAHAMSGVEAGSQREGCEVHAGRHSSSGRTSAGQDADAGASPAARTAGPRLARAGERDGDPQPRARGQRAPAQSRTQVEGGQRTFVP